MTDKMGGDPDGRGDWEELQEVEGREIVIRLYYVRKKIYSQLKEIINLSHGRTLHPHIYLLPHPVSSDCIRGKN